MTRLARITVYPIKSLDGCKKRSAQVLPSGALEHDRRFALLDSEGRYVNGKRCAAIHQVRCEYDHLSSRVTLSTTTDEARDFSLADDRPALAAWVSEVTGQSCQLQENPAQGFPDDTDAPGPTLISTPTLAAVAEWFGLSLEQCRRRFRANIEIDAPCAFWEDRLVGQDFTLGPVCFHATGVCQRCVVPTRDAATGEPISGFQKRFAKLREKTLPADSPRERFNHFYRLAINTRLVGFPGVITGGDQVRV